MNKNDIEQITGMMNEINKLMPFGCSVEIETISGNMSIYFASEKRRSLLIYLAKEFGAKITNEETTLDKFPYKWSFIHNGVKLYTLAEERYEDAENEASGEHT